MQYLLLELKFTFAYFQNACKISWTSGETKTPIFFFFTKHMEVVFVALPLLIHLWYRHLFLTKFSAQGKNLKNSIVNNCCCNYQLLLLHLMATILGVNMRYFINIQCTFSKNIIETVAEEIMVNKLVHLCF